MTETIDITSGALPREALAGGLETAVRQAEASGAPLALVVADLDRFGPLNDRHGAAIGDVALRDVHDFLRAALAGGTIYRAGNDEFVVLLPGVEREAAFLWAEERRRTFGAAPRLLAAGDQQAEAALTLTIAVGSFPEDGPRPAELLRRAMDAMHRAKTAGRNRVVLTREEKMVTKTSHYTQGQLDRLSTLAKREALGEAVLLREALDALLARYGV